MRVVRVLSAMFLVASAFVPGAAEAVGPDYVLVRAVADASGADGVQIEISGEVAQRGPRALVAGAGVGADLGGHKGGIITAESVFGLGATVGVSNDGLGARLGVGSPVGLVYGFSASGSVTAPALEEGDVVALIVFFPNGEVLDHEAHASTGSGSVTVETVTGTASRTLDVGEAEDGGQAVAVNGIATGAISHTASASDGLIGTIIDNCDRCSGTWTAPGGTERPWSVPQDEGSILPPFRMFAGPSGEWAWTWEGDQTRLTESSAVYGAYVEIGDDWEMFRSGSGQ